MISIVIPTHNRTHRDGVPRLAELLAGLRSQTVQGEILLIDSSGTDGIGGIADRYGAQLLTVAPSSFDHGRTRTVGGRRAGGDIIVYLTHDALPLDPRMIERLVAPLIEDPAVAISYGRQLPHGNATSLAAHLRSFNYPATSHTRSLQDRDQYGIKTVFLSNGFAAYRRDVLEKIGWFKDDLIMCEDVHFGARAVLRGYKIAYVAEAQIRHSHNYSLVQEFRRYFDIGVFHSRERWIMHEFGRAEGEGRKYLASGLSYLARNGGRRLIPDFLLRSATKFIAYQLGRVYWLLPRKVARKLSMHRNWWLRRLH